MLQEMKDQFDHLYDCHGEMIMPVDAVDEQIKAWDQVRNRKRVYVCVRKE